MSASESPATCFLTGVWRATVLLGPTPAAINPLMALCPYAFLRPLLVALVPSPFCILCSLALSLFLFLPYFAPLHIAPHHLHPHQNVERDNPSLFSFHPSTYFLFSPMVSSSVASLFLSCSFLRDSDSPSFFS